VYALLEGILFSVIHTTNKSPKEEREWRGGGYVYREGEGEAYDSKSYRYMEWVEVDMTKRGKRSVVSKA
jgi:hypothetical protein